MMKNKEAIQIRPSMGYMLTQVLYHERKLSFHISIKTHFVEFSTFSRLPSMFELHCSFQAWWTLGLSSPFPSKPSMFSHLINHSTVHLIIPLGN